LRVDWWFKKTTWDKVSTENTPEGEPVDEPCQHPDHEERLRELVEMHYLDEQDLEAELAQDREGEDEE
jgi:hypothetical protein